MHLSDLFHIINPEITQHESLNSHYHIRSCTKKYLCFTIFKPFLNVEHTESSFPTDHASPFSYSWFCWVLNKEDWNLASWPSHVSHELDGEAFGYYKRVAIKYSAIYRCLFKYLHITIHRASVKIMGCAFTLLLMLCFNSTARHPYQLWINWLAYRKNALWNPLFPQSVLCRQKFTI